MGKGYIKAKNKLKMEHNGQLRKMLAQLEAENTALKNDPKTVIGQFIGQFRELYAQNQRLSTLAACTIKKLSESVVLSKDEMEQFNGKRINIKWEIDDSNGETIDTAKEFTFTYELLDAPEGGQPVQATETPGEIPECTDPDCALPKDLKHRHTPEPLIEPTSDGGYTSPEQAQWELDHAGEEKQIPVQVDNHECNDPDCEATVNGPHIHVTEETPQ